MCGRFALALPLETVTEAFDVQLSTPLPMALEPRYNIAPTQPVLAVRLAPDSGERELALLQWGLIPSWAKDPKMGSRLINARSETAAEKPAFRAAFKRRRCLIPASGFYEWQQMNGNGKRKQPMYVQAANGRPLGLAGLWEVWQSGDGSVVESCTILTTAANELMAPIHDRMPVIIDPVDYEAWLDPALDPGEAQHLLRPYSADNMVAYPVSTLVNSPYNEQPQCIEPLAQA
jgi:putative SOS response-associated peptidase YedK